MKQQKTRKLLIMISMLLFPVTLYYFSPALIIGAAINGMINGSFIVFILLFLGSIPFGRLFCAYLCPGAGIQECAFAVNDKIPKQGFRNYIKYGIWIVWIGTVAFCYFHKGSIIGVNFFYETEMGISVINLQGYIIYYGIVCLMLIPALLCGRRTFCHYFCWMAPFMAAGIRLRRICRLPGLHIEAREDNKCTGCGKCNKACPMGINVKDRVLKGSINSLECINCGACAAQCPGKILNHKFSAESRVTKPVK